MKNTFFAAALVAITSMTALPSCTDKDQPPPEPLPPQPQLLYAKLRVGSGLDTLPLLSAGNTPDFTLPPNTYYTYASKWQSRWTCTAKPAGAPEPTILDNRSMSTRAVGLSPGNYRFDITYTTASGSKTSTMEVAVVPDKPAGTIVILDNISWNVYDAQGLGGDWFGPVHNVTTRLEYPDLFFFRGKGKEPGVEYFDPKSNQWIKATIRRQDLQFDMSKSHLRFNERDEAYFDYIEGTMTIGLVELAWDPGAVNSPPVRLTY